MATPRTPDQAGTLAPLLHTFRTTRGGTTESGVLETGVPGVTFFWNEQPVPRAPLLYDAGVVIVAQGHKVGYLGERRFIYDADTCLVLGVPVPFECEVEASPQAPLLGIRIDIDITALHSLVACLRGRMPVEDGSGGATHAGVEPVPMDVPLLNASKRLIDSLGDPLDREVLGPAAVNEIIYRVLRSAQGHVLHALTQHHTPYASVARALTRIHKDYRLSLPIEELAKESAMSVSTFHRAFKQTTGESPLQYLKKIRLLKAKGLLVFEGARVEEAAFKVGYVSASQFSREFKSYFNVPPSLAQSLPYNDAP